MTTATETARARIQALPLEGLNPADIEYFVDETWVEHLRRLERFTAADAGLREQRLAFHRGAQPPAVRRFVAEGLDHTGPWPGRKGG